MQRPMVSFDIHNPTRQEQTHLWEGHLQPFTPELNGVIPGLINQFDLSTHQIRSACLQGKSGLETDANANQILHQALWTACRVQARPQLDDLAQRLTPREGWDDLVLPEVQKQILQDIVVHVRQRSQVYHTWGFADKTSQGLGISALFAGISGTGKTMAAGVLAQTLNLDLYRIDLSAVVSKYIGETEKNLRRIFDAAESGGIVLLFDEADALFGKRSDVKDSHDRYANMEVSYLLQRMEAYRGLAILTTNLKDAIDTAFLRRIRFIVRFPFPDIEQRQQIWQQVFPPSVPTQGLNYSQLAKLNVAGGIIRNIALGAAFLAADAGQPVTMDLLLSAAQREFAKLERALPPAEVKGWTP
jgi:SpoVK/Ycf46/Vps4 family AAA+-type ATPase